MNTVTITMTIDADALSIDAEELAQERMSEHEVENLIRDALGEFVAHRGPTAAQYIQRRYPIEEGYEWLDREEKLMEVVRRCMIAKLLRCGHIKIDHSSTPHIKERVHG